MTTMASARRRRVWTRLKWFLILAALVIAISFLSSSKFGAIVEALTPPNMPEVVDYDHQRWLNQNWTESVRTRFHHISQGTRTIPISYDWFVNLQKPSSGLLGIPFASDSKLSDNDYLLRFGFIKGRQTEDNPDALPIGFSRTPLQSLPGFREKVDAIGFTCAACHTGQLVHDDTQYVIEGGPAMTDLGQLTAALGAALGQTALSSKIPLFDYRFDRFARNVLGSQYSDFTKEDLAAQLQAVVLAGSQAGDIIDVQEGFTRLDALNRIGNQVFDEAIERPHNYAAIDAPVNFPHIWTSSWFNWVQYDGSIMQPLIRNAGEALGVNAYLDVSSPLDSNRFSSSIPMRDLVWIEDRLRGEHFAPDKPYTGLTAPPWPEAFGAIDPVLAEQGAKLYQDICQDCHLPPLNSEKIWDPKNYGPIVWKDINGQRQQTNERVLHVKVIPHWQIGTDTAQANVLTNRVVDTSGKANVPADQVTPGMGLDTVLCSQAPEGRIEEKHDYQVKGERDDELVSVRFKDGGNELFALALGATMQQTIAAWFDANFFSKEQREAFWGERPNCLQAEQGYRARPLNGVWATGPFLHNGSVPTLMALLSPPEERPSKVQLGETRFDIENVGILQDEDLDMDDGNYADNGLFILDTSIPGNSNRGHEFSDRWDPSKHWSDQPLGVIGPKFDMQQRRAIIEYLKTL